MPKEWAWSSARADLGRVGEGSERLRLPLREGGRSLGQAGPGGVHHLEAGQAVAQDVGHVGVMGQEVLQRRPLSGLEGGLVLLDRLQDARVIEGVDAMVGLHSCPSISRRSDASPRTQSFLTLSTLRPICWAMSGKACCSRWRRTITSR